MIIEFGNKRRYYSRDRFLIVINLAASSNFGLDAGLKTAGDDESYFKKKPISHEHSQAFTDQKIYSETKTFKPGHCSTSSPTSKTTCR